MSESPSDADVGALAVRINELIDEAQRRDGVRYTHRVISRRAAEHGFSLSPGMITHIRRGRIRNPGLRTIEAFAVALNLDIRRFAGPDAEVGGAIHDDADALSVQKVGFRLADASGLNELGQKRFASLIEEILADLKENDAYAKAVLDPLDDCDDTDGLPDDPQACR